MRAIHRFVLSVLAALACGAAGLPGPAAAQQRDTAAASRDGFRFTRLEEGPAVIDVASSPSASWADVDIDGDEDLFVLNGYGSLEEEPVPQPDALYRNDGTGRLTRVSDHPLVRGAAFSGSAVWADYDADGDLDVFVANQRGSDNVLFRADGAGGFVRVEEGAAVTDGGRSFSAAWVDMDGDGLLDLHVANGRDGDGGEVDFVYRNRGGGELERVRDLPFAREALPSGGPAWGDYDGDGDLDLFLPVHAAGPSPALWRNDGDWRFTDVTSEAGLSPAPFAYWPAASVARWLDWDGDGDLDLYVGTTGGMADFLFENVGRVDEGRVRFERRVAGRLGLEPTYVSDALWVDLDDDADRDLVIAAWGGATRVWRNDGEGRLRPADAGELDDAIGFASSVSAADVDGDGDLDLYLTQWPINQTGGAPNRLYRNDGAGGHWLAVALRGQESNGSGVGARIVVTATIEGESRSQLRRLTARTSWRSTGPHVAHFGLADAGTVDRIEVRWPAGRVEVLEGPIRADRRITIVEGRGIAE